jgi:hypothetical protein
LKGDFEPAPPTDSDLSFRNGPSEKRFEAPLQVRIHFLDIMQGLEVIELRGNQLERVILERLEVT